MTSLCTVVIISQFEKTSDHLFEAAYHGQTDAINGNDTVFVILKQVPNSHHFGKYIFRGVSV